MNFDLTQDLIAGVVFVQRFPCYVNHDPSWIYGRCGNMSCCGQFALLDRMPQRTLTACDSNVLYLCYVEYLIIVAATSGLLL